MALWVCTGCTAAYSVGARCCPQCGSTDYVEEGQDMPKITVHGGPSIAGASVVGGSWSNEDAPDGWPTTDEEGGEESSPGSSSSTSDETPSPEQEQSESRAPLPVRTTGSRSKRARTGGSTARGTDGDQTERTSAADAGTEA